MNNAFAFTISTDLDRLLGMIQEVNDILESRTVPPQAVYKVNLALEEILTNVSKYGYDDGLEHEINIRIELRDNEVFMRCEDDGRYFDPLAMPRPDFTSSILERDPGGLGLFLVRDMVDSMDYRRDQGKNILEIRVTH